MMRSTTRLLFTLALALFLWALPGLASAAGGLPTPPLPILGPRMTPPPIPHSMVSELPLIETPQNALIADAVDGGRKQEEQGRGIRQTLTGLGAGLTLYDSPHVCNSFNPDIGWAAIDGNPDIWTDWYAGWAPFALNDGIYQAKNVVFTRERSVGPGRSLQRQPGSRPSRRELRQDRQHATLCRRLWQPAHSGAAGYENGQVQVSVRYLIWDHDTGGGPNKDGLDYDWASLGVKPGADGDAAFYVNGYVRGEWAEMENTVDLNQAKDIMVLIQGQSPGPFNSNIYFDDVKIAFVSPSGAVHFLQDCTAAEQFTNA